MYVCIYIYIYTHTHIFISLSLCVKYIYVYIYIYIYTCIGGDPAGRQAAAAVLPSGPPSQCEAEPAAAKTFEQQ